MEEIKENIEDWGLTAWTTVDQNANDLQVNASDAIKSTIKSCKCVLMCRNNFYLTFIQNMFHREHICVLSKDSYEVENIDVSHGQRFFIN